MRGTVKQPIRTELNDIYLFSHLADAFIQSDLTNEDYYIKQHCETANQSRAQH